MNAAEQFNKLDGQLRVSRKTLENLLSKAKKERDTRVSSRIVVILDSNPEKTVFTIQLKNLIKPYSLNGARHNGIAKVGLDECGRLQPGFIFDGRGNVIPAIGQEKTRPARKCTPSCDKPKLTVRNNPSVSKTTLDKSKKAVKSLVNKRIVVKQKLITPKIIGFLLLDNISGEIISSKKTLNELKNVYLSLNENQIGKNTEIFVYEINLVAGKNKKGKRVLVDWKKPTLLSKENQKKKH